MLCLFLEPRVPADQNCERWCRLLTASLSCRITSRASTSPGRFMHLFAARPLITRWLNLAVCSRGVHSQAACVTSSESTSTTMDCPLLQAVPQPTEATARLFILCAIRATSLSPATAITVHNSDPNPRVIPALLTMRSRNIKIPRSQSAAPSHGQQTRPCFTAPSPARIGRTCRTVSGGGGRRALSSGCVDGSCSPP